MNQLWASLIGVVLGGGMSYLAQLTTARQAARTEDKRQATQPAETRRAERLDAIREFVQLTQQGIRLAEERYEAPDWSSGRTPEWHERLPQRGPREAGLTRLRKPSRALNHQQHELPGPASTRTHYKNDGALASPPLATPPSSRP
ncbi:hypothetical protein [Streptomyces sp. SP17KL33]|uniref:hypothetical protein n=1 Tax=Streptomyces sp. SP17KL33 TaxID=3002534 RepID=UPI002E793A17|nr:hypothetical protein [Streptomyces sp. SP17KL33]MEE1830511.1 hypothetical protein [Streptomyces sp. SP17KL33]